MIRIKIYGDDSCMVATSQVMATWYLQNLGHIYIDVDACYNWLVDSFVFMQFQ